MFGDLIYIKIMEVNDSLTPSQTEVSLQMASMKKGSHKLEVFDWLNDIHSDNPRKIVEIRFKSTRKDFYENVNDLRLQQGDIVAVEASPGHDIGIVSLTGELVLEHLRKCKVQIPNDGFKKVYRKARTTDIEKWEEAKALEHATMIKARKIARDLRLNMKIGDVEYQGDKTKAIFYYIADERVDFRELIKKLAEEFKIRVEMRQIGARQEAGRIGGIGSCGKELCCTTHVTRFVSVTTNAARVQEVSLNPQKLAGQCGKLKCCMNYELDSYLDARQDFPDTNIQLKLDGCAASHIKTDVYKRTMWYVYNKDNTSKIVGLSVDKVHEIIELNRRGVLIDDLENEVETVDKGDELDYQNIVGQESLTRFDDKRRNKNKNKNKNKNRPSQGNQQRNDSKPLRDAGETVGTDSLVATEGGSVSDSESMAAVEREQNHDRPNNNNRNNQSNRQNNNRNNRPQQGNQNQQRTNNSNNNQRQQQPNQQRNNNNNNQRQQGKTQSENQQKSQPDNQQPRPQKTIELKNKQSNENQAE